jgi:hypothetical protein
MVVIVLSTSMLILSNQQPYPTHAHDLHAPVTPPPTATQYPQRNHPKLLLIMIFVLLLLICITITFDSPHHSSSCPHYNCNITPWASLSIVVLPSIRILSILRKVSLSILRMIVSLNIHMHDHNHSCSCFISFLSLGLHLSPYSPRY